MIPPKYRKLISEDPFFSECVRKGADCDGRITIEHAFIYARRQIQEMWAYVPLCVYHHLGKGFDKNYGQWIALMRGLEEAVKKYPKENWHQLKKHLDSKYLK